MIEKKSNHLTLPLQLKPTSWHFLHIVVNSYIVYKSDNWPRNPSFTVTIKVCFLDAINLTIKLYLQWLWNSI